MNSTTFNTIALKALEQTDENLAVQVISNPDLDGKELSGILDKQFLDKINNTNEHQQLSNTTLMAGLLNRLIQINNEQIK
jgi:hypothetical protein